VEQLRFQSVQNAEWLPAKKPEISGRKEPTTTVGFEEIDTERAAGKYHPACYERLRGEEPEAYPEPGRS
jgi:hypothetical protein